MNPWLGSMLFATAVLAAPAELVHNGDFRRDLPGWHISLEKGYGYKPTFQVQDGALHATGLKNVTPTYLMVRTALDIRKGVSYRISFEYRGPARGEFAVWIGEMQPTLAEPNKHFVRGKLQPGSDWQTFEAEFVGKYDTDPRWYKQWMAESRNNRIIKGTQTEGFKNLPERPEKGQACRSPLMFLIGGLEGEFALRNVSVVERN